MLHLLQLLSADVEMRIRQKHPGYFQDGLCHWRLSCFSSVVRVLDTAPETEDIDVLGKGNVQVR